MRDYDSVELSILSVILISIAFSAFVIFIIAKSSLGDSEKYNTEKASYQAKYLKDHSCKVVAYVGQYPEAVYQCDNGMIMVRDIK